MRLLDDVRLQVFRRFLGALRLIYPPAGFDDDESKEEEKK